MWQLIKRLLKPLPAGEGSDNPPRDRELYDELLKSYGVDFDSIVGSWEHLKPDSFFLFR